MTDLITAEEAEKMLDGTTPGLTDHCLYHCGKRVAECPCMRDLAAKHALATAAPDLARTVIALHAQLADAQAAQAMVVERCAEVMDQKWFIEDSMRDAIKAEIRALAPASGVEALAALRAERDEAQRLMQMRHREMLAADELMRKHQGRAVAAEADRDRLAAANAVLEAKVAGLRSAFRVNMLRFGPPGTSHEEIDAAIDAALATQEAGT